MSHSLKIPARLQRSRRKGSQIPEGAIYVGRPTLWGNPFRSDRFGHAKATILHARWLRGELSTLQLERLGFCAGECETLERRRTAVLREIHRLRAHDLVCWCPTSSRWCHADTLLAIANPPELEIAA